MDFGKGMIVGRNKNPISVAKPRKQLKRVGVKGKIKLEVTKDADDNHILNWTVFVEKFNKEYPLASESKLVPLKNIVTVYCNPYTNPTYKPWEEKRDKLLKFKDSHTQRVVSTYWSPVKPDLIVYGEIVDNEFKINI
jgi:hypothetical protein